MLANKDPAIKLFGKKIQLGSISEEHSLTASRIQPSNSTTTADDDVASQCTTSDQNLLCSKQSKNRAYERCSIEKSMDQTEEEECCWSSDLAEPKTPTTSSSTNNELESEKGPKKPEEILACPRCNSMNTKFCYFNNYNVSQPRHFCKNCQRYWTAGGTMRNMPVGSGRRKNKTSSAHHLLSPEPPIHQPNNNKESEVRIPFAGHGVGWRNQGSIHPHPQVACFGPSLSPWPYAWNPIPWQSAGCPLPFYHPLSVSVSVSPSPSPQWVCSNPAEPWNFLHNSPFLGKHCRDGTMLVPSNSSNKEPTPTPTLKKVPVSVSVPKTLRIVDDPNEVARSSAWGSLGMKKDNKPKSSNIFGGFHHYKGVDPQRNNNNNNNNNHNNTSLSGEGSHLVNQANPAAFSRSLSFHEVGL